jgi:hypothetical protein
MLTISSIHISWPKLWSLCSLIFYENPSEYNLGTISRSKWMKTLMNLDIIEFWQWRANRRQVRYYLSCTFKINPNPLAWNILNKRNDKNERHYNDKNEWLINSGHRLLHWIRNMRSSGFGSRCTLGVKFINIRISCWCLVSLVVRVTNAFTLHSIVCVGYAVIIYRLGVWVANCVCRWDHPRSV